MRLTKLGFDIGLASQDRLDRLNQKTAYVKSLKKFFESLSVSPEIINPILDSVGSSYVSQKTKLAKILSRPQINYSSISDIPDVNKFMHENGFDKEGVEQVMIQIKYSGYINREKENAEKLSRLDHVHIPKNFQYHELASLSSEAKQKLTTLQPKTIAHASRVSGVSPADISVLLVYMGR